MVKENKTKQPIMFLVYLHFYFKAFYIYLIETERKGDDREWEREKDNGRGERGGEKDLYHYL